MDSETGLIYLRARYYDPSIGAFISEDPAHDGLNWYAYCAGDPVNFVDPWGLESYIFYTTGEGSDFTSQANWQKELLQGMGESVTMVKTDDAESFIAAWNSMGEKNGEVVDINHVVIYSHGNDRCLILEEGSSTNAISVDGKNSAGDKIGGISSLDSKKITGEVSVLACNAGNLTAYKHENQNFASVLSTKVENGDVIAYDGNVSFGKSPWKFWEKDIGKSSRLATNQHGFKKILNKYGEKSREPVGKIHYRNGLLLEEYLSNQTYKVDNGTMSA